MSSRPIEVVSFRLCRWGIIRFRHFGQIAASDSAQLGADQIGRETGAKQAAVDSGDVALVKRTANVSESPLQANADEFSLARFGKNGVERAIDVPVWDAAHP
jgi:hypothetical protein